MNFIINGIGLSQSLRGFRAYPDDSRVGGIKHRRSMHFIFIEREVPQP
jgi:hypothetical protein